MKNQQTDLANVPTICVVFGITGDLAKKKVIPTFFHMFTNNRLPNMFKLACVGRRDFTDKDLHDYVSQIILSKKNVEKDVLQKFCELFTYHKGDLNNLDDYLVLGKKLKEIDSQWKVITNKLFYLCVPPELYEDIITNLAASKLAKAHDAKKGWTRVLVEKPFGKDLKTAERLDKLVGSLFKEDQIYRIDHYLAKEMLQNILAFRFANNLFEMNWDRHFIEQINMRLFEEIGVEDRGNFYDDVGALQDVGQNHLLQMIALITMDQPKDFKVETIRKSRAKILKTLITPSVQEIKKHTVRAQYTGYQNIVGVKPESQVETYFKVRAFLNHSKWRGVPIVLEGGKRLKNQIKEIEIIFKHQKPCMCPKDSKMHYKNRLTISMEPTEKIMIHFWSKKIGLKMELEERTIDFHYRDAANRVQYTEEYEKLLLDCIAGDQTLFISSDEVKSMWKFIDPIVIAWQKGMVPLKFYKPNEELGI